MDLTDKIELSDLSLEDIIAWTKNQPATFEVNSVFENIPPDIMVIGNVDCDTSNELAQELITLNTAPRS